MTWIIRTKKNRIKLQKSRFNQSIIFLVIQPKTTTNLRLLFSKFPFLSPFLVMSSSRSSICGCYHQQQQQQQHQNNNNKNYRKNQQTILNHDGGGGGGDLKHHHHHHHPYMKIIRKNDDGDNDWLSIEKLSINPAITTTNTKSSSLLSSSNRLLLLRKWPINCLLLNNNNKSTTTTTKTTTTTTKMMFMMATLIIILLNIIINIEQSQQQNPQEIFTNSFHIRFRRNVDQFDAHQIAKRYGFINLGPVRKFCFSILFCFLFSWSFPLLVCMFVWFGEKPFLFEPIQSVR